MIWLLKSFLPKGPIGDLLAVLIIAGGAGIVLEQFGIPVFGPVLDVLAATVQSVIDWFLDAISVEVAL